MICVHCVPKHTDIVCPRTSATQTSVLAHRNRAELATDTTPTEQMRNAATRQIVESSVADCLKSKNLNLLNLHSAEVIEWPHFARLMQTRSS